MYTRNTTFSQSRKSRPKEFKITKPVLDMKSDCWMAQFDSNIEIGRTKSWHLFSSFSLLRRSKAFFCINLRIYLLRIKSKCSYVTNLTLRRSWVTWIECCTWMLQLFKTCYVNFGVKMIIYAILPLTEHNVKKTRFFPRKYRSKLRLKTNKNY